MSYCPVCNDDMSNCHRDICPFRAEQNQLHGYVSRLAGGPSITSTRHVHGMSDLAWFGSLVIIITLIGACWMLAVLLGRIG